MDLTGLINYDIEIAKMEKTLSKIKPLIDNLDKKVNILGYRIKVLTELAVTNNKKLSGLNKKVEELTLAIDKIV